MCVMFIPLTITDIYNNCVVSNKSNHNSSLRSDVHVVQLAVILLDITEQWAEKFNSVDNYCHRCDASGITD